MSKNIIKYVVFWDRTGCSRGLSGFTGKKYFIAVEKSKNYIQPSDEIKFQTFNSVEVAERFIKRMERRPQNTGKGCVMTLEDAEVVRAEFKLRQGMVP